VLSRWVLSSMLISDSHCDTCKVLSGAPYTLNQIIPADALSITKGKDLGNYTYKGDSGKSVHCVSPLSHFLPRARRC
jgi:hypothetical protein